MAGWSWSWMAVIKYASKPRTQAGHEVCLRNDAFVQTGHDRCVWPGNVHTRSSCAYGDLAALQCKLTVSPRLSMVAHSIRLPLHQPS